MAGAALVDAASPVAAAVGAAAPSGLLGTCALLFLGAWGCGKLPALVPGGITPGRIGKVRWTGQAQGGTPRTPPAPTDLRVRWQRVVVQSWVVPAAGAVAPGARVITLQPFPKRPPPQPVPPHPALTAVGFDFRMPRRRSAPSARASSSAAHCA
jgi:hypothetical protein